MHISPARLALVVLNLTLFGFLVESPDPKSYFTRPVCLGVAYETALHELLALSFLVIRHTLDLVTMTYRIQIQQSTTPNLMAVAFRLHVVLCAADYITQSIERLPVFPTKNTWDEVRNALTEVVTLVRNANIRLAPWRQPDAEHNQMVLDRYKRLLVQPLVQFTQIALSNGNGPLVKLYTLVKDIGGRGIYNNDIPTQLDRQCIVCTVCRLRLRKNPPADTSIIRDQIELGHGLWLTLYQHANYPDRSTVRSRLGCREQNTTMRELLDIQTQYYMPHNINPVVLAQRDEDGNVYMNMPEAMHHIDEAALNNWQNILAKSDLLLDAVHANPVMRRVLEQRLTSGQEKSLSP